MKDTLYGKDDEATSVIIEALERKGFDYRYVPSEDEMPVLVTDAGRFEGTNTILKLLN